MPEWQGAFAEYAASHPGCGQPVADIQYLPPDWSRAFQYSRTTVLVWDGMVFACPEPGAPPPAGALFFEDWDYVDVGPLLTQYADLYAVPVQALIGLIHTESAFNTNARRYGVWPDVSGGYSQMTVSTAYGYGIGNGDPTEANVEYVLSQLCDRETGIRLATEHYAGCLSVVDDNVWPPPGGDERLIYGCRVYNGGAGYGLTDAYEVAYAAHIASYRASLELAYTVLRNKGYPADSV